MNRFARVHRTTRAKLELEQILDLRAFDLGRALAVETHAHSNDAALRRPLELKL